MDFFEIVYKRQSIRKFKTAKPPTEDIQKIVDAARVAPSATNSQNWQFIAVLNEELKNKMAKAVAEKFDTFKALADNEEQLQALERYKNFSIFFNSAPCVFVVVEKPYNSFTKAMFKGKLPQAELDSFVDSSLLSAGGAIENLILAATALGYSTCWMSAPTAAKEELKAVLNLKEEDRVVSIIPMGIADNAPTRPLKKPLDEVLQIIE